MEMISLHSARHGSVAVQGRFFGARSGSCSCDPCDCNPCKCADAVAPNLTLWRVSGCALHKGHVGETDLAQLVLFSLAQASGAAVDAPWSETLLIDQRATPAQVEALLTLFDEGLDSWPAEIERPAPARRAVYLVPINYTPAEQRPHLQVAVTSQQLTLVRAGEDPSSASPHEWIYDGPMALREPFHLHR